MSSHSLSSLFVICVFWVDVRRLTIHTLTAWQTTDSSGVYKLETVNLDGRVRFHRMFVLFGWTRHLFECVGTRKLLATDAAHLWCRFGGTLLDCVVVVCTSWIFNAHGQFCCRMQTMRKCWLPLRLYRRKHETTGTFSSLLSRRTFQVDGFQF